MNAVNAVVFGHYDSRGGTVGMQINERTAENAREAFRRYDRELFGVGIVPGAGGRMLRGLKKSKNKRAADKAVEDFQYGGPSPAVEDFLFVAELWYPKGGSLTGELDEGTTVILIDEGTAPPQFGERYPDGYETWDEFKKHEYIARRNEEYGHWARATFAVTLDQPVQLELVMVPEPFDPEEVKPDWFQRFAVKLPNGTRREWGDDAFNFWFYPQEQEEVLSV